MELRAFQGGEQAHEAAESVVGPALAASFETDLEQGAVGGFDGSAAAEQLVLAEQVVAQAGAVGVQVGAELGRQRGRQAGQGRHGLFHGRAVAGPEAGVLGREPGGRRAWAAAASFSATW